MIKNDKYGYKYPFSFLIFHSILDYFLFSHFLFYSSSLSTEKSHVMIIFDFNLVIPTKELYY